MNAFICNRNPLAGPAMGIFACPSRAVDARRESGVGLMGLAAVEQRNLWGDFTGGISSLIDSFTGSGVQKSAQEQAARVAELQAQARIAEAQASGAALAGSVPYIAGAVAAVGIAVAVAVIISK